MIYERFIRRVRFDPSGCWIWLGGTAGKGYGYMRRQGTRSGMMYAHRFAYEWLVGPIPDGFHIDHLCRVPACVNPDHLEAVTHAENLRRGNHPYMVLHRANDCYRGHGPEQQVYRPSGERRCRVCQSEREKAARKRKRQSYI